MFVKLTNHSEKTILLNIDRIVFIAPTDTRGTIITFDDSQQRPQFVKESIEEIQIMFKKSGELL